MTVMPDLDSEHAGATAPAKLNILLAMCYLAHRTGAELFTRDIALWLRHRGHSVTVFATTFGEMADELRHESIACITDPQLMMRRPDIIIGNTHHETVRAILRFPDVPALSICHDRSHEHGRPPRLSQVRQFIAVDENCAERLYHENGIAPEQVHVIANGVDLQRFKRRGELPAQPRRALVFSSYAQSDALLEEIRTACTAAYMQLDVIGSGVNNLVSEPASLLGDYDLVFAKGRAATEAIAVGCACILLDHSQKSIGFLVDPNNMEIGRKWNFGRALLTRPITRELLQQEIALYDAQGAARVTDWVRANASLDATGGQLESLALKVVHAAPKIELPAAQQTEETLRYMSDWVQSNHPTGEHLLIAQLRDQVLQLQQTLNEQQHMHSERLTRAQAAIDARQADQQALLDRHQTLLQQVAVDAAEISRLRDVFVDQQRVGQEQARQASEVMRANAEQQAALRLEIAQLNNAITNQRHSFEHALATDAQAHGILVSDLLARQKGLRDHVDALLASASWRVTAPLRFGLRALRKLFG